MRSTLTSADAMQLAQQAAEVTAQPRHRAELDGMGDLVDGDPGQELAEVDVQLARRVADVRRDEQQPRGGLLVEERQLVLAQDAPAHEPDDAADLAGQEQLGGPAQRAATSRRPCPGAS